MSERQHFLPSSSSAAEQAVSAALDRRPELAPAIEALHAFKYRAPNESILPALVMEYGLGPITPYLPDLATVIFYGVPWSRVRGTPQGVRRALSWIGYAYDLIHEAPSRRMRWNLFELDLDRVRDDEAHLDTIEAVVRLSQPARSEFWRGYDGYNVREFEWGWSRWGSTIWGDVSGVRLHEGGVKWSFGRTHEPAGGEHRFTESELTALGVWIEPVVGSGLAWGAFPWSTAGIQWSSDGEEARAQAIAAGLLGKSFWAVLRRGDGSVIGYRKARSVHCVIPAFAGRFEAGGSTYEPADEFTSRIFVEALSAFGEGEGDAFASWSLVIGGAPPAETKPGVQWLDGDTLSGGVIVGDFPTSADQIGKTDRQRMRGIFRI